MYEPYVKKLLGAAQPGDRIRIGEFEGRLMPKTESSESEVVIIKLDNGYNIGLKVTKNTKIEFLKRAQDVMEQPPIIEHKLNLPKVLILHTGGTIASKVDYKTGGVTPAFTRDELLTLFPELSKIANIDTKVILSILSENMSQEHYAEIVKQIALNHKDYDGIIIGHGTDTMHYTAAALAFMLEDVPIPIILVGSQRSSDRGSSDAGFNLRCATHFAAHSDFSGVAICMHGTIEDNYCYILHPCRTRKQHASRRDAFTTYSTPIAKVGGDGRIETFAQYTKRKTTILKFTTKMEERVALVKIHPDFEPAIWETLNKKGYKGVVVEGTGMGHVPLMATKQNRESLENLKKLAKKAVVVMTTQTYGGRVNMNIYSAGRELLNIGVVGGEDMLPEVAFMKLKWLLANRSREVKELIRKNLRGELTERSVL